MKTDLYLDGHKVQINKDIDFVLNKQYVELSDLTKIIVDYSKTISIPMTPANNELFNMVFKLDHQVLLGTEYINYDPTKKIPMQMVYNGDMVMEGYAILNNCNLKEKTYELNLFGQLGKIFSELKNKTIKEYIDHIPYPDTWGKNIVMNIENIEQSFLNDRIIGRGEDPEDYDEWTYCFGFAPQLYGATDIIDTSTYQTSDGYKSFADLINEKRGINYGETLVGDGFDWNQYGEMRTYMTRPYIYVNRFLQFIRDEINNGDYDGYSLILDENFFSSINSWYNRMVYFPSKEIKIGKGQNENGNLIFDQSVRYTPTYLPYPFTPSVVQDDLGEFDYDLTNGLFTIYKNDIDQSIVSTLVMDNGQITITDTFLDVGVGVRVLHMLNLKWGFNIPTGEYKTFIGGVPVRYIGVYDENDNLIYKLLLTRNDTTVVNIIGARGAHKTYTFENLYEVFKRADPRYIVPSSWSEEVTWTRKPNPDYVKDIIRNQYFKFDTVMLNRNKFKFKMGCDIINGSTGQIIVEDWEPAIGIDEIAEIPFGNNNWAMPIGYTEWETSFNGPLMLNVNSMTYRSFSRYNITDILGADFVPFDWLLDFAKTFRLMFDIDYKEKTITLTDRYFDNIEYVKPIVDYSKGVSVEPIVYKDRYINFGYKENESTKAKQYKNKYGVSYGDLDIDTTIFLNDNRQELSPNKELGVMIPTNCSALNFDNLTDDTPGSKITYGNILGMSNVINTLNEDGKMQYFPFYAYRMENYTLLDGKVYYLTDDTPDQMSTGKYTLLDREYEDVRGTYIKAETSIPRFDNYINIQQQTSPGRYVRYRSWVTFNMPKEIYNGEQRLQDVKEYTIYSRRWENYLNELYNSNNKKVTCYIIMSYSDYVNFKFNKLLVIDNCTFLVNRVIDFDPNSEKPTKVELIQIQDPNNLK